MAFGIKYSVNTFLIITVVCVFLMVLGFWLGNLRRYEKARLEFRPEGIIMCTQSGFIPMKYESIKKIKLSNIIYDKDKSHFYLIAKDNRKFEIQTDQDVYEGLAEMFPE